VISCGRSSWWNAGDPIGGLFFPGDPDEEADAGTGDRDCPSRGGEYEVGHVAVYAMDHGPAREETISVTLPRGWLPPDPESGPTAAWIWRQVLEATPLARQPKFLIHDRDAAYGGDFDERLANLGITGVRTPPRAPKANAIGERIVRTIRTECLDHVMVINERHLQAVLAEFADYYNRDRPHRSLELASPVVAPSQPAGRLVSRSVLGSLHHVYARAA